MDVVTDIVSSDPVMSVFEWIMVIQIFPDSDIDSDSDLDYKPNSFIVLCRILHTTELYSDPNPNC